MTQLPQQYQWLLNEPGPKMLIESVKLYGIKEAPGNEDNPEILEWAKETGLSRIYSRDAIPWCGLEMAVVAKRAGKALPPNPLWALNWQHFGVGVEIAMLGDVLVFKRPQGGHVALYIGEDKLYYYCLGGNQSDAVTITRIAKSRCVAIRRPKYINQPSNVRVIRISIGGAISSNEA